MQKEKIALIALVIVVVAALSVFLVAVNTNIIQDLFKEKLTISVGDCAEINYVGRYSSNNTIFDKSYTYVENKSGGTPLKVFVTFDKNATSPKPGYSSDLIKGFMQGLIGMQEGQTKTIGPIPPKDAYGVNKFGLGAIFTSQYLAFGVNQTVIVTNYASENFSVKWINVENLSNFTMPQFIINNLNTENQTEMVIYPPPFNIWENSTSIINITDTNVTVKLMPTKSTNLSDTVKIVYYGEKQMLIFPNATTATWNDTSVTVVCAPKKGTNYTFQTQGYSGMVNITVIINNITGDKINISVISDQSPEGQNMDVYRVFTFNRTFVMPRIYKNIPVMYISYVYQADIEKAGYSVSPLAGESLTFEVTVEKVFKTSQGTS
jgi:FKBP-type peptidyl-prolyl cis-trans isomerase 2